MLNTGGATDLNEGVILRSGPASSETAEMGVPTYLGVLVGAGVGTRWNVMGSCCPCQQCKVLYLPGYAFMVNWTCDPSTYLLR